MDDPVSAVDALTRENLRDELLRIWPESGKAVIFVPHDIAEAAFLADRVIVLAGQPAHIALEKRSVCHVRARAMTAHCATSRMKSEVFCNGFVSSYSCAHAGGAAARPV